MDQAADALAPRAACPPQVSPRWLHVLMPGSDQKKVTSVTIEEVQAAQQQLELKIEVHPPPDPTARPHRPIPPLDSAVCPHERLARPPRAPPGPVLTRLRPACPCFHPDCLLSALARVPWRQERFDRIDKLSEQRFDELKETLAQLSLALPQLGT